MEYRVELFDACGRRVAVYDELPLLEVVRTAPDEADSIRGILPNDLRSVGPGYTVRVTVDDGPPVEATIHRLAPHWGDERKLILDRYVRFHEVIEFSAEHPARDGNTTVVRAYTNREISAMVKDVINSATGAIHYLVDHDTYPDGAVREYDKFAARQTSGNELEVGGIARGQWVGAERMDLSGAYAKDGDTISGVVVDGVAWPDLRLMMIDSEELSRNSHAVSRHPEVADWTEDRYARSGYKLKADAARDALQAMIDTYGIDYLELNPHQDITGAYDDRIDAYGRYITLVYGGGQCFNAAMVELGHADVYLYADGKYHTPEMALKDYFSYLGPNADSIADASNHLVGFDANNGVFEILTALAYAAGGYTWSVDHALAVSFRPTDAPDHIVFFDPRKTGITWGSNTDDLGNILYLEGNPFTGGVSKTYTRGESIDAYGVHARRLSYFSISLEEDADRLASALLDDLAYPEREGEITFFQGNAAIQVGDLVALRDGPLRAFASELPGEWGSRVAEPFIGRVRRIVHRMYGRQVLTEVVLTSPLRSVSNPLSFIIRSQPGPATLYQFRLDDMTVGLDAGFHLD